MVSWKREHIAAIVLLAVVGAGVGLAVGYIALATASGGTFGFGYWLWNKPDAQGWAAAGAVAGAVLGYAFRLLRA